MIRGPLFLNLSLNPERETRNFVVEYSNGNPEEFPLESTADAIYVESNRKSKVNQCNKTGYLTLQSTRLNPFVFVYIGLQKQALEPILLLTLPLSV